MGAAVIAAYRLGVISAGPGAVIFLRAGSAHGKHLHAGALPVIGKSIQNGHSGTAAGTVDKRMEITAVGGIVHLLFALLTDGDVRGNIDLTARFFTLDDGKRIKCPGLFYRLLVDLEDGGPARRLFVEKYLKAFDLLGCTLGENLDIGPLVADTAADPRRPGMAVHRRAEPDALHDSIYTKAYGCAAAHRTVFLSGRDHDSQVGKKIIRRTALLKPRSGADAKSLRAGLPGWAAGNGRQ